MNYHQREQIFLLLSHVMDVLQDRCYVVGRLPMSPSDMGALMPNVRHNITFSIITMFFEQASVLHLSQFWRSNG